MAGAWGLRAALVEVRTARPQLASRVCWVETGPLEEGTSGGRGASGRFAGWGRRGLEEGDGRAVWEGDGDADLVLLAGPWSGRGEGEGRRVRFGLLLFCFLSLSREAGPCFCDGFAPSAAVTGAVRLAFFFGEAARASRPREEGG